MSTLQQVTNISVAFCVPAAMAVAVSSCRVLSFVNLDIISRWGDILTVVALCTGFGQQLARPLFRERHDPNMSEEDATKLLHEGLRVCAFLPVEVLGCGRTCDA